MNAQPESRRTELEVAFRAFNRTSAELIASYRALEHQVARLSGELECSRAEKDRQSPEGERLDGRLSLLLDALPGGVVVLDRHGVVTQCNPAARELLDEDPRGELWREVVRRAFAPRPDDGHDVSLASGRRVNIGTCSLGSQPGQILLLKDVTETRDLQEKHSQLKRLSAMGEMAAALAHQIRTPLASALLYAGSLGQANLGVGERQRYAEKLRNVLSSLERLVADMLAFARRGDFQVEELPVDELYAALQATQKSGPGVSVRNDAGGCVIQGNHAALLSVLQNLIDNALQAGGPDTTVEVCFRRLAQDRLQIVVGDDGPGIPEAVRDRIFEPFFTTRSGGTGLGLAVVQAVVRSHGGRVAVAPGRCRGAAFAIDLPAWCGAEVSSRTPSRQGQSGSAPSRQAKGGNFA